MTVSEAGRHSDHVLGLALLLHCSLEVSHDMNMKIESSKKEDKVDLSEYFGALKDSPLLDKLEADSWRIRELAKPRTCFFEP